MDVSHFTDPALFEWLFTREILDLVEAIIGQDSAPQRVINDDFKTASALRA